MSSHWQPRQTLTPSKAIDARKPFVRTVVKFCETCCVKPCCTGSFNTIGKCTLHRKALRHIAFWRRKKYYTYKPILQFSIPQLCVFC